MIGQDWLTGVTQVGFVLRFVLKTISYAKHPSRHGVSESMCRPCKHDLLPMSLVGNGFFQYGLNQAEPSMVDGIGRHSMDTWTARRQKAC